MRLHILQQPTLYDRKSEKTIVIIMRVLKIMPPHIDNLHKDRVKHAKKGNIYLTNRLTDGIIVWN